jgi:hypothetical protein
MDLDSLKIMDDEIGLPIYNPFTGEKTDIVINVIGRDSEEYKQKARNLYTLAIKKAPRGDISNLNHEDDESFAIKLKAAHIKGWENITENGKTLVFSSENAEYIIRNFPVIADQVAEFVANRANFMKAS